MKRNKAACRPSIIIRQGEQQEIEEEEEEEDNRAGRVILILNMIHFLCVNEELKRLKFKQN